MNSIRGRLLLWQISALMLTGLLVSIITYLLAWDAFNKIRDYGLEQIAYSVVRHGVQYDNDEEVRNDRGQFVSQIWTADNSLFFSSIDDAGPPKQSPGLHVLEWQGTEWRIFTLQEGGMTIQVATTSASRARKFAAIAPWLLLPLVVLVVVLGLLIRAAVGRALAPLEQVRTEVSQRSVSSLHALDMHNMPDEVAPLVATLNELLVRLDEALISQRRFIADAAHELRSPLTAVKLQAQLASRANTQNEREIALAQLTGGVDRAAHLVEQLLHMARLEPSARQGAFQTLSLDTLIKKVVADFSTQAEARDIDLGVSACASINITGQADSLRMLLGNLLDNALRYSPTGGRVDVELGKEDNQAVISVYDSGPGIPETERERVFERFYRVAGSDVPGSGLGLSIVRQVAVLHGGHIELNTAKTGGLAVRVVLPLRC
jgi:signal transduction histidine kinase